MPRGMIIKGVGGNYTVESEKKYFMCKPRGKFRKNKITPLPGDIVEFSITDEKEVEGYLLEILPRKNHFIRPAVANIDQLIIVISIINPLPDLLLLDKLICMCEAKHIDPIICVNKIDLVTDEEIEVITKQYEYCNYPIVKLSGIENTNISALEEVIKGKTSVFAGQSGVGKSTILNQMVEHAKMETGELSQKVQRGKHTTRHAEFIETFNGYIVDTPGFSNLSVDLFCHEDIKSLYTEFRKYDNQCKYNGCIHIKEDDCAIKEAIGKDINSKRHGRYIQIYNLAKEAVKNLRGY